MQLRDTFSSDLLELPLSHDLSHLVLIGRFLSSDRAVLHLHFYNRIRDKVEALNQHASSTLWVITLLSRHLGNDLSHSPPLLWRHLLRRQRRPNLHPICTGPGLQ